MPIPAIDPSTTGQGPSHAPARPRSVVIGAGIGGLAVAIRLLDLGHDVTVLEARRTVGGRASRIRDRGYTFDTGPSLITMPWLFDELFRLAGTSLEEEVALHRLDPGYRIYWTGPDGRPRPRWFDFTTDLDRLRSEVARFSVIDAGRLDAFLEASRRIHEQGVLDAGQRPFLRLADFLALVPRMIRLDALRSLDSFVGSYFRDPRVRQVFDFHSLFIGGDPRRVPGIYAALVWLQLADGIWYSDGGVYSVIEAMHRLIGRGGGRVVTGARVERIVQRNGVAVAVRLDDGTEIPADVIVANTDVTARSRLLPDAPEPFPWNLRPFRTTMSAYLLYLGTTRRFPQLLHHTLIVGSDYRGFIRQVTGQHRLPDTFSFYIHAPTRTDPSMAPHGRDALSVLLPVPNLRSATDWGEAAPRMRERVVDALEAFGLEGLRSSIEVEHAWTPLTFRDALGAPDGNAFAIEPSLLQSAYFRQPNRDRGVRGVYWVGGGTHPGAGMPGTLMTARVTADLIAGEDRGGWSSAGRGPTAAGRSSRRPGALRIAGG
jgi:phytoene desaturase